MTKCVATAVMRNSGSSGRGRDTACSMTPSSGLTSEFSTHGVLTVRCGNHPFDLLSAPTPETNIDDAAGVDATERPTLPHPCPCCGGRMIIIEIFAAARGADRRHM